MMIDEISTSQPAEEKCADKAKEMYFERQDPNHNTNHAIKGKFRIIVGILSTVANKNK